MTNYVAHEQWGVFVWTTHVEVDKRLSHMPYAQAGVNFKEGGVELISYSTSVCYIDADGWLYCNGTYSATTRKHIGAFLKEYGNGASYYDAKRCYECNERYNIFTGEVEALS